MGTSRGAAVNRAEGAPARSQLNNGSSRLRAEQTALSCLLKLAPVARASNNHLGPTAYFGAAIDDLPSGLCYSLGPFLIHRLLLFDMT